MSLKSRTSSELLLPPRGAGVAFVRREFENSPASRRTFRLERSSVLGRVRTFLPQLAASKDELQQRMETGSPNVVDIECVEQNEPHIEMDLALVALPHEEEMTQFYTSSSEEESEEEEEIELRLPGQMKKSTRTSGIEELQCH